MRAVMWWLATVSFAAHAQLHAQLHAQVQAQGQTQGQAQAPTQTANCPKPDAMLPPQLHGDWTAQFTQPPRGWPAQARVRLQAHVEFKDSLSGTVQRSSGPTMLAHLAGDLDDGVLLMDESSDGVHITAVWEGAVQPGSCGREIRGQWKDTRSKGQDERSAETPFVLTRSQPW